MADRKITDLSALSAGGQATGDLVTIVDVSESAAADKNKKMTVENLFKGIPGDVGIGTSAPSAPLTVFGGSASSPTIRIEGGSSGNDNARIESEFNLVLACNGDGDQSDRKIQFRNNDTDLVTIDSSGSLGIGDTTPDSPLHVKNSANTVARFESTDSVSRIVLKDNAGEIRVGATGNNLTFHTSSSETERMRIDSDGSVLIGASSDFGSGSGGDLLQVASGSGGHVLIGRDASTVTAGQNMGMIRAYSNGGSTYGESSRIQFSADANHTSSNKAGRIVFSTSSTSALTERMRIDSSGRVGIGESTPAAGLDVKVDQNPVLAIDRGSANTANFNLQYNGTLTGQLSAANADFQVSAVGSSTPMSFYVNGSQRMRLDNSGRLLVGLTSARATKASASVPSFQIEGTGDSDSRMNIGRNSNADNGPEIHLYKTRGTALGSNTIVQNGDFLGTIGFFGADGNDLFSRGADITAAVDGTPGSDDMPTRLTFGTCGDGSGAATERFRIDSSGHIKHTGLRSGNGDNKLANYTVPSHDTSEEDVLVFSVANESSSNQIVFGGGPSAYNAATEILFRTASAVDTTVGTERMRIRSDGIITAAMGNTANTSVAGNSSLGGFVITSTAGIEVAEADAAPAKFNRISSDGGVVEIIQGGVQEGSISVSGSTVSYNGAHLARWSQLASGAERTEILRGSVLSNLDEMCEWAHAAQDAVLYTEEDELPEGVSVGDVKTPAVDAYTENNEQLNRMKVSDVEGDVNVAGVFQAWDDDDDTYTNDFYCAMTGDFVIRIAQGTSVARGDLLMSAGDGTAKPQDDDIVRSKTIAKVTSTTVSTTYADGSYCVPCVLMAC